MGKAGLIGQKIAATLASTGTPAQFLHPAEALHGDLGRVARNDVVLALSNSGETEEMARLLPSLRDLGAAVVAITARRESTLGRYAQAVVELGEIAEACPLGLAPSASTAAMLAVGDALALVVSRQKGFAANDFARYHPGGSLGRKLARVEEVMRPLAECRVARDDQPVRDVIVSQNRPGRRTGAIMLIDADGRLSGVFTDSDLARRIADGPSLPLDEPIATVMTRAPKSVPAGSRLAAALEILSAHKISELPVLDADGRPLGLIDVTDVVELLPSYDEPPAPRIYREPEPTARRQR
jgi:arabinose-5-phosphate isomerase